MFDEAFNEDRASGEDYSDIPELEEVLRRMATAVRLSAAGLPGKGAAPRLASNSATAQASLILLLCSSVRWRAMGPWYSHCSRRVGRSRGARSAVQTQVQTQRRRGAPRQSQSTHPSRPVAIITALSLMDGPFQGASAKQTITISFLILCNTCPYWNLWKMLMICEICVLSDYSIAHNNMHSIKCNNL
jgi:hypothetical protein